MKKLYISPDTKTIRISVCPIMQASNGQLNLNQTIYSSEDFGSRRHADIWGDDEEE